MFSAISSFKKKLQFSQTSLVYCILCLVAAVFLVPVFVGLLVSTIHAMDHNQFVGNPEVGAVLFCIELTLIVLLGIGLVLCAKDCSRNVPKHRLQLVEGLIVVLAFLILCHLALYGLNTGLIIYGLDAALLIALHSYWDPQLALERANKEIDSQTLRETIHGEDERYTEDGKVRGHGYITLNFFNLFWIFTIASIIGLCVETLYFYIGNHWWMNRAGMLWGPLSPIYGFGAILMTIALNRLHNKNFILIFLVSAVIGGAFEFFTSWYLQTAFGITAWNYSGTFLNIDGRTNFFYMCCWGLMGLLWIKFALPLLLWFIKKIPWGWRYTLTTLCAILMLFDGIATVTVLDCWYMREAGLPQTTPIEKFCAVHFDNEFMENRFQTMTMNVHSTARTTGLDGVTEKKGR